LFLIYINDICKAVLDDKVKMYADDTNLFLFDTDANNLNIKANTSLKELSTWFEINKLSLNIEKTCYTVFSSSPKDCMKLVLNATDIQKVHMCKYLGLYFDVQLTWRLLIDYVYNRLFSLLVYFINFVLWLCTGVSRPTHKKPSQHILGTSHIWGEKNL